MSFVVSIFAMHIWGQLQQSHHDTQPQSALLYLWHRFLIKRLVYIVCIFSVFLPGKVFWSSFTAGNSFTSDLSSLLRESQQLQTKFSSRSVCSSCKWKDFKCQPSKPGISSQLTRTLYTSPRSPVSTCRKYEEKSTVRNEYWFTSRDSPRSLCRIPKLNTNQWKSWIGGWVSVMRESILLFFNPTICQSASLGILWFSG